MAEIVSLDFLKGPPMGFLMQYSYFNDKEIDGLKVKGWENILHENSRHNKPLLIPLLILGKVGYITGDKKHFKIIKGKFIMKP